MSMKLHVGNLSYSTSEDELAEVFGRHGAVRSVKLVIDRETGRHRGIAYVEFDNREEGEAAMASLNGSSLSGRAITVEEDRPQERRDSGRRDSNRGGDGWGGGGGGRGRDRW
jgi:cold-inducible RNA-binding protein